MKKPRTFIEKFIIKFFLFGILNCIIFSLLYSYISNREIGRLTYEYLKTNYYVKNDNEVMRLVKIHFSDDRITIKEIKEIKSLIKQKEILNEKQEFIDFIR